MQLDLEILIKEYLLDKIINKIVIIFHFYKTSWFQREKILRALFKNISAKYPASMVNRLKFRFG